MKYKIGDLVRFVDEDIEGHITSFQDHDMVGVTDDTGFELPVLISKITLVQGDMKRQDDDFQQPPRVTEVVEHVFVPEGIHIAITADDNHGLASFHILNDTSYELLISISKLTDNFTEGIAALHITPRNTALFHHAQLSSLGKWPTFKIEILRFTTQKRKPVGIIDKEIKIRPMDLSLNKKSSELLNQKAWIFQIDNTETLDIEKLQSHFISHRPKKK